MAKAKKVKEEKLPKQKKDKIVAETTNTEPIIESTVEPEVETVVEVIETINPTIEEENGDINTVIEIVVDEVKEATPPQTIEDEANKEPITWEQQQKEREEFANNLLFDVDGSTISPKNTTPPPGESTGENTSLDVIAPVVNEVKAGESTEKIDGLKEMKEVYQIPKQMSVQAKKWDAYLRMNGQTPAQFLDKYPYHPSKQFVEEIVEFNKTKGE